MASSLLSVPQLRRTVQSDLDDAELSDLIDEEEATLITRLGPHGDGVISISEVYEGSGADLFLNRPAVSVTSITQATYGGGAPVAVATTNYQLLAGQGRILNLGTGWSGIVTVVYVPVNDKMARRQALVDLVRLKLERTAMKSENIAGEHSYTAPESWEAERAKIYRSLSPMTL